MGVGTWTRRAAAAVLTFAPLPLAQPTAHAQSPAEFYRGRNVELYIGYSVGGAYDLYARVLARHLGKHIPGSPTIVPKNMEGAGSLRLAKPTSVWARLVYPANGRRLRRSQERYAARETRWVGRRRRFYDLIGGTPHLGSKRDN